MSFNFRFNMRGMNSRVGQPTSRQPTSGQPTSGTNHRFGMNFQYTNPHPTPHPTPHLTTNSSQHTSSELLEQELDRGALSLIAWHDSLPPSGDTRQQAIDNFIEMLLDTIQHNREFEEYRTKVIDDSVLETFALREYTTLEQYDTCSITQVEFEEAQLIMELTCGHIFDEKAIKHWLTEKSNKCPVCRYEFPFKYIQEHIPEYALT